MARISGSNSSNKQQVDANLAARVSITPPFVDAASAGRYRAVMKTGLATLLSAHTASAGHWCAFRNASSTKVILVDKVRIAACMITDFTTLQRFDLAMRFARGFTVLHTAGAAVTLSGDNAKMRTAYPTSSAEARIATTGDLTVGTVSAIDSNPMLVAGSGQPSDGATVGNIPFGATFEAGAAGGPIVLAQNEGLIFSNEVLMGAAGTANILAELEWREMLIADAANI